jgi:hypothetical protein
MLFSDYLLPDGANTGIIALDERKCMQFIELYGTNSNPVVEAVFNPDDTFPAAGFGLAHIYSVKPHRMRINDYILQKHKNYLGATFPEFLKFRVRKFCRSKDMTRAIGMHIRNNDNLLDPTKKNLVTPFSAMEQKLQRTIAEGHTILLCTDNPEIRQYLRTQYAEHILLPDAVIPIFQPLYEMMLLSHTARIVGTYSSTFSYEASLFNGTDLEVFVDGQWEDYRFSLVRPAVSFEEALGPMARCESDPVSRNELPARDGAES